MTILQSLQAITPYPFSPATLLGIAEECGLEADAELCPDQRRTPEFKRAKAHVYLFLTTAPNLSQNGISFSFTSEERKRFKAMAHSLLSEIGDDVSMLGPGVRYGYRGEDF